MKGIVRWRTDDPAAIGKIRKRFGIPSYSTLNGWCPCEIEEADMEVFRECVRRGFFLFREVEWRRCGSSYAW